jgi:hypothetical protein
VAAVLIFIGGVFGGVAVLVGSGTEAFYALTAGGRGGGINSAQLEGPGPPRATYDYRIVPRACVPFHNGHNRCGSMTKPVFDSFVNTPSYGDERAFFDGRLASDRDTKNRDPIENALPSDRLSLRAYINDDANDEQEGGGCDASAPGVAMGARLSLEASQAVGVQTVVKATIMALNAATVYDYVTVRSSSPFLLVYVPGTAQLLRDRTRVRLSDTIATPVGALVGWHRMDGDIPGCFAAGAVAEAQFLVVPVG